MSVDMCVDTCARMSTVISVDTFADIRTNVYADMYAVDVDIYGT